MKLKDILTTETWNEFGDMDVYNDVTDSVYPAWCGNLFTEEGREHFAEVLELEAETTTVWDCAAIIVHTDGENWKHNNALVRELFVDMAGYCTEEEYERWFIDAEEDEPDLGPMPSGFIDDQEKMRDFFYLTKDEFLASYSYLTEEEYDDTLRYVRYIQEGRRM